jgi:hypothetical protein
MKILKLIFLAILLLNEAEAQNRDYVITINGDTLKGQFIGKKFKADGWAKARELDLAGYKETYQAAKHDLERAVFFPEDSTISFLPVIINGKISLYQSTGYGVGVGLSIMMGVGMRGGIGITKTMLYYAAKGTGFPKKMDYSQFGKIKVKSQEKRMDTLGQMLMDNKVVYNKFIADDNFTLRAIKNIIHLYDTGRPLGSDVTGDYVIKNNKDTIYSEIEPATMNTRARYRISEMDEFIRIDTSINEYYLSDNSSTYVLKTLPKNNRRQYVKLLIKGKLSLYCYSINNSAEDSDASLFIEKQRGELVQIKHAFSHPDKNEKKAFADMVADEPKVVEKVKDPSADFKSIFNYIVIYNNESVMEH